MSHVEGHIVDLPQSPGKLRPIQNGQFCIDLLIRFPQNLKKYTNGEDIKKGDRIGFHPYYQNGEIWAKDIVPWDEHIASEAVFMGKNSSGKKQKFEDIYSNTTSAKTQADKGKSLNGSRDLTSDEKAVILKTIEYMASPDFGKFYLTENPISVRSTDDVVERIRELILYP
jgi:hypothetical protein